MSKSEKFIETLLESIKHYVDSKLSAASFDVTKKGFVNAAENNVYSVQIGSATYSIKSQINLKIGDTVYVLFPQNDPKNRYIIGKAV